MAPATAGFSANLTQTITLEHGAQSIDVLAVTEISPRSLRVVVLDPLGHRVLFLDWDGRRLQQERDPALPAEFPAELILRDLQLAYWPAAALQAWLPKDWSMGLSSQQRRFFHQGSLVIQIHYSGDPLEGSIDFEHKALGYRLHIQPSNEHD